MYRWCDGGVITAASSKQKLNTMSSTEAELLAVDDFMSRILHTQRFLSAQGVSMRKSILQQNNKSTILLSETGRSSLGKRTRNIVLRYFFVTDMVAQGEIEIKYCPSEDMLGDYMSKPLQGNLFFKFRKQILGM